MNSQSEMESEAATAEAEAAVTKAAREAEADTEAPVEAVEANEFGLDAAGIEAIYRALQAEAATTTAAGAVADKSTMSSSSTSTAKADPLADGQLEMTEADSAALARLQLLEAEGRPRKVNHGSELHPAVVGHNQSMQRDTQRLVRQWFCEQRYQVDKLTGSQRAAYRQLARLHVDRRRKMRESQRHRQEEARLDAVRAEEQRRRQRELAKLARAMAELRAEEEAERRRQIDRLARTAAPGDAAEEAATEEAAEAEADKDDAGELEELEPPSSPSQPPPPRQLGEGEVVTLTARVVEVDRTSYQAVARQRSEARSEDALPDELRPLVRSRSKSFLREPSGGLRALPDNQGGIEGGGGEPEELRTPPPPQSPTQPLGSVRQRPARPRKQVTIVETLPTPPPPPPLLPPLTQAERNRRRARRLEAETRRVLDEPYQTYRLTRDGRLEPLESLPPKFPTAEPSNRPLYEHHKRLQREREAHRESMRRLDEHTAMMLRTQEEAAAAAAAAVAATAVRIGRRRSQQAGATPGGLGGGVVGGGQSAWASVFVRSDLPEGVEPGSFEAMRYIEYIRPDPPRPDRPSGIEHVFNDLQ